MQRRFYEQTAPGLRLLMGTTFVAVVLADRYVPLGFAVWIGYLVPLGLTMLGRSPVLPLWVAGFSTVATVLFAMAPFTGGSVVQPWVAYTNRGLYVVTLWPVAFMARNLIRTRLATERDEWLKSEQNALMIALQGELPVAEVAVRALRGIAQSTGAHTGALYLKRGASLTCAARHAVVAGEQDSFAVGEGLVGEVAETLQLTTLSNLPAGFLRVEAGVGASAPASVVLAPLVNERQAVGVAALGRLSAFNDVELELLRKIAEPVAAAILSAQHKARLRELLLETQRQADELTSQQVELEAQQASLEAQQAELEAQQAELEANNQELQTVNTLMERQNRDLDRQREETELQRQNAERASRYKSEFLANMSHELRTPLNSSLILSRILADNKEGNLTEDQIRSAETIYNAGNDLLTLINDILDLSKIEAGHAEITPEPVRVARVLDNLERAFRPVAGQKSVELRFERGEGAPDGMVTDERRLEQVLRNLLSNALKFTERGEVVLKVSRAGEEYVCFTVQDTGIGIPKEQREVIFEAFRQADGTTSRRFGGTGLGLSISRELVRLLGGSIELVSAVGRGSAFSVVLPLRLDAGGQVARPEVAASAPHGSPGDLNRRRASNGRAGLEDAPRLPVAPPSESTAVPFEGDDREHLTRAGRVILAVEDDHSFANILCQLAHELDFDCVIATSAEEGFALARKLQPLGILLDVALPDSSGLWLLDRLKRTAHTRHIPVHMMSALDNVQTALELGAIGYAVKPVAKAELARAIRKLEEQRTRGPRRVLIVEDDLRQRESIQQLLQGEAVELVAVGTVKDALEQLQQTAIDCMVLDLALPDGTGYDLLEKMADGTRYSMPPVIVYTGRDLGRADEERLRRYSRSVIVKGARSPERLLDEVTLFLHQVESALPSAQRKLLADSLQRESAFDNRRILIVEDDARNVFALSRVLEPRGAKVEIARNGREALNFLESDSSIDLVLMDLMMPEMDGLSAIRELRSKSQFKRLPIIALTAKAMPDDQRQALAAGANDYMTKPFDVEKLVSLCRVWLPR